MQYSRELKKKLCEDICFNHSSTLKTANEYNIPIKTLEKWITAFNKDNHSSSLSITNDYIDLYNSMDKLSSKLKTVVMLRFFEDMKLDEISRITGDNVSTVKTRLYKALRILKLDLEVEHEDK